METNETIPTSQWCFEQRDEAYARGDNHSAEDYHSLGLMWEKRENS